VSASGIGRNRALVFFRTGLADVMGATRKQTEAAAGAFDAQQAIDRLESDLADIWEEISHLHQSTRDIEEIKKQDGYCRLVGCHHEEIDVDFSYYFFIFTVGR
jgi:hypothetical protein